VDRDRAALRNVETTQRHILLTGRATLRRRVEASLDICSWRRSRCTVAPVPEDGTRHPQLQPARSSAGTGGSCAGAMSWRGTARYHVMQRDRATLYGAERPRVATACRQTARCHVMQRDRATLYAAETAHSYGVQRDRAMPRGAERPRVATACRGTERRYSVQRNRAMPRGAEGPRLATSCRETARCHMVQRDRA